MQMLGLAAFGAFTVVNLVLFSVVLLGLLRQGRPPR